MAKKKKIRKKRDIMSYAMGTGFKGTSNSTNIASGILGSLTSSALGDLFSTMRNTRIDIGPEYQRNQNRIMANGGQVQAPANVEGGEVFETPGGSMGQFKGAKHEQGGMDMNLPKGTKIFSERLKVLGKSMADRKKTRESKLMKAQKAVKARPKDKIAQNSLDRITELNQIQEQEDMQIQNSLNDMDNMFKYGGIYENGGKIYAYGGITSYANGGEITPPVKQLGEYDTAYSPKDTKFLSRMKKRFPQQYQASGKDYLLPGKYNVGVETLKDDFIYDSQKEQDVQKYKENYLVDTGQKKFPRTFNRGINSNYANYDIDEKGKRIIMAQTTPSERRAYKKDLKRNYANGGEVGDPTLDPNDQELFETSLKNQKHNLSSLISADNTFQDNLWSGKGLDPLQGGVPEFDLARQTGNFNATNVAPLTNEIQQNINLTDQFKDFKLKKDSPNLAESYIDSFQQMPELGMDTKGVMHWDAVNKPKNYDLSTLNSMGNISEVNEPNKSGMIEGIPGLTMSASNKNLIDFNKPGALRNIVNETGNITPPQQLGGFSAGQSMLDLTTGKKGTIDFGKDKNNIPGLSFSTGKSTTLPGNDDIQTAQGIENALLSATGENRPEEEEEDGFLSKAGDFLGGLIDKLGGKGGGLNMTKGDKLGMFGTKVGGMGPLATTLANRWGDTPNVNWMRSFGRDALAANQAAKGRMQQIMNAQLRNVSLREASARKRNAGQTRSLSTQRALNLASDQQADQAELQAQSQYAGQIGNLFSQQAGLEQQQDQAVLGGEQARDLADRQDRDQYHTNLAQNLTGMGSMYQAQGKNLNVAQHNKDLLAIMPELSQYGFGIEYGADGKPKLVQSK